MTPEVRESFAKDLAPKVRPDLDGDGAPDAIYADSPSDIPVSLVYVSRGACSHFVAQAVGEMEVRAERTNGWPDLRVTDHGPEEAAGPGTPPRVTTLRFDGTSYVTAP